MKKNYFKKQLLTAGKAMLFCSALLHFGSAKAQVFTDLGYTGAGGILENIAVNQVLFGNVDPAAPVKGTDMLVVGYTTSSVTAGTYVSGPYVKIYKNNLVAPFYTAANSQTLAGAGWDNTNHTSVRRYTNNFAAWSKKDSKVLVTGSNGATKFTKLYKPDGLGGFTELPTPVVGGTALEGVYGYCGFGDFDGDGDDDILLHDLGWNTTTRAVGYARVYRNDGADTYTLVTLTTDGAGGTAAPGYTIHNVNGIAISDVNGDAREEILLLGNEGTTANTPSTFRTTIYTADASMQFTRVTPKVAGADIAQLSYGSAAFIDTDGDGNATDILLAGTTNTVSGRRFIMYKRVAANPLDHVTDAYAVEFDFGGGTNTATSSGLQYGMIGVGDITETGKANAFITSGNRYATGANSYVGLMGATGYNIYNSIPAADASPQIPGYNSNATPNAGQYSNLLYNAQAYTRAYIFGDIDADGKRDDMVTHPHEYWSGTASFRVSTFAYVNGWTVLPVTGVEFTAKAESNGAKLTWSTQTEKDNKEFIISRSIDGSTFTQLATVAGAGTSSTATSYEFTDKAPVSGTNYYKLQQVDINGKISDLGIKPVRFGLAANTVAVFPNPTKGSATVIVTAGTYSHFSVVSIQGTTVATGKIGANDTQVNLNLSSVAAGTYIIKLTGVSGSTATRVIKL